jgi:very-short-patch-repair endonuclease
MGLKKEAPDMIDYIVFFGLIAASIIVFILYERKPKETIIIDHARHKAESPIERRLYDALKARGEVVTTQVPCGKYRIDIALPAYHLAIECDGKAYHSTPQQKAHDKRKDKFLRENGWKVLRFSGSRITRDLRGIIKRIEQEKSVKA